ncbi:tryptophan synthase alpha chain [Saccharophagus degradans]|uniref:Uncharacterized protein n=1 Tax=Saccharophagus degradans (strain 2-40 / ATCC 43961 / DSM 17024) TaxID=203122 RepID=Q21J24_SACD2|nr:tryptophan synthase alpha chain [Saccharophagus degradans]ABD81305.1 hypothetical protein Sde_2045 [Saccharophagus degradans 2-40]
MNNRISENTMKFRRVGLTLTKFLLLLITCVTVYTHADSVTKGYVYSRGVVEEDDGTKYWAEYNPETGRLENHFPATDTYALDKTLLISGLQYRAYVNRWEDIKKTYKDAEILSGGTGEEHPPINMASAKLLTEQFKILQPESADPNVPTPEPITFTFTVNDIETAVDAYDINDDVRHVILRPPVFKDTEQQGYQYFPILNNSGEIDVAAVKRHIILAQMPINPDEVIAENTLSLLVSSNTEEMNKRVVKESPHNIGLLTSFVNGVEGAEEYDGEDYLGIKYGIQSNDETEFTNPIQDAHISTYGGMGFEFHDLTDEDGKWGIVFAGWIGGPPCWIMTDMYSPIQIEMYSKSFNPRLRRGYPYYVQMPHYLPCNGNHPLTHLRAMSIATSGGLSGAMAGVNLIALAATSTTPIIRMDYIMDMKILAGQAELSNEHLSRDATQDIYSPIDRRSEVLDPATQAQWAASGWDKSISVSDSTPTEYRVDAVDDAEYKIVQQNFDLDGDGEKDTVKIGQFNCKTPAEDGGQDQDRLVDRTEKCTEAEVLEFKVNEAATNESKIAIQTVKDAKNSTPPAPYYQAIYYSASAAEEGDDQQQALPDIVRLLDDAINDYHQGLLKVIAEDDLRNTDIYVFRESSGDLLAERSGLAYRDLSAAEETTDTTNFDVDETNFHYRLQMRGGVEGASRISGRYGRRDANGNQLSNSAAFERWQNLSGMNPKFYEREADHIRPGEPVKIVAINRATGYIGTAKTVLDIKDSIYTVPSIRVPKIKMGPPNLKIWAERELKVEYGLTKDEDRNYLIGSEGGAETDDVVIKVYTEWLDQDGSALPEQLKDFGYTARLGKLTGENTIENYNVSLLEDGSATTAGQSVRYFPINPGKNLQLIRVSEANAGTQHLYVQVNGESYLRNPDFSGDPAINIEINNNDNRANNPVDFDSLGAGTDQLQYRPKHYVPILTPIWDENSTLENKLYFKQWEIAQEAAAAANNGTATDELNPFKPGAAYKWRYRPEYQFTVYDLEVKKVSRVNIEPNGNQTEDDILGLSNPIIASTDELVSFIYNLTDQVANPISLFSGESKELVLALGEEEFAVNFGNDQTINIENLDQMGSLDIEDFLTLRLYTNNDAHNLIWEYAFEYLDYYAVIDDDNLPSDVDGAIEISADENEFDLVAHLIGFANRPEDKKYEINVIWLREGEGCKLEKTYDSDDEYAIFKNHLTMPTKTGDTCKITAKLTNDTNNQTIEAPLLFRIVPGKVETVTASVDPGSKLYVGGAGVVEVKGVAIDQHSNPVANGTGVSIFTGGAIKVVEAPGNTVDGEFSFKVEGADYAELSSLTLRVGEKEDEVDIQVDPVDISFEGLAEEVQGGAKIDFFVTASAGGNDVANYEVDVWVENGGRLTKSTVITDSSGRAPISLLSPPIGTTLTVKAMVAMQPPTEATVTVTPNHNANRLNTQRAKLVGDANTETLFEYTRWDDNAFSVNKAITGSVNISGTPDDEVVATLGDIFQPNRLTQASYWMNDASFAKDEVGFSNGELEYVGLSSDTKQYAGGSYSFSQIAVNSRMVVPSAPRIKLTNDISFKLDLKPGQHAGEIINLGNALKLVLLETGQLQLTAVNENSEVFTVEQTEVLPLEYWHTIAGSYTNGKLTLAVNSERYETDVNGILAFDEAEEVDDLVVGAGYTGLMNSLKWYNLASEPLVLFENNQEVISVVIGPTGTTTVGVTSTGKMQSFSGRLPAQSVAITSAETSSTVELLSTPTFEAIAASTLAAGIVSGAPEFDLSFMEDDYEDGTFRYAVLQSDAIFPRAYAYDISFWTIIDIASALIGLDSLQVIWTQVGNMLAGRDVDVVSFSVAILDVLSLFPPAAPLKAVTVPAKLAIKLLKLGNNKAVKYLGGVMKKMFQKAKGRDFTLVYQGIAFFIIVADMALDEEARAGITEVAKMINSTDDFLDILDFFSLADDEISLEAAAIHNQGEYYSLFPSAYASVASGAGVAIGKTLKEIAPVLAKSGKEAPKTLGELGRVLKETDKAFLKNISFDKNFLTGILSNFKAVGVSKIRGFLLNNRQRVGPITLTAIIAYLETELEAGRFLNAEAIPNDEDRQRSIEELRKLYVTALPGVAAGEKAYGNFVAKAFGAQFQLLQLGILHGMAESVSITDLNPNRIVGIEVDRKVLIFELEEDLREIKSMARADRVYSNLNAFRIFTREIDILTGTRDSNEIWREMKSYKGIGTSKTGNSPVKYNGSVTPWKWNQGKGDVDSETGDGKKKNGTVHRQLTLDRVAKGTFAAMGKKELTSKNLNLYGVTINVQEVFWHFHDFKTKTTENPALSEIIDQFTKPPVGVSTFYTKRQNPYLAKIDSDTFILGNLDLFITSSKTELEEAIKAEIKDKIDNIEEEVIGAVVEN